MRELTLEHFAIDSHPVFPLAYWGEVWYMGWDIPGYWAIDAAGQGFADFGAHGICLRPHPISGIIHELEACDCGADAARLRALSGRKPPLPSWIRLALSTGWIAPPGFNRDDYE